MIDRVIEFSARNRYLVLLVTAALMVLSLWALKRVPLDAIPDLSDTQVILWTEWMGRGPELVEDQITYPLVSSLVATPKVKTVRGYSMFGMSFVYVLFQDGTDLYWARSRVLENISRIRSRLPEKVEPQLGPDATGIGWVYQYALVDKSGAHDLADLRSLQDWQIRYALESVPGVAEVAPVGGFRRQYQVVLDPSRLQSYGLSVDRVIAAVRASNADVGGGTVELSGREYVVRGRGYLKTVADLEQAVVAESGDGTPIRIKDVAQVQVGPEVRRGLAELDGEGETVGAIVVMRDGENALDVIERVKQRIEAEINPSLPSGVEIVPVYDRSTLILAAIDTLRVALIEEALVVSFVIFIFLLHLRSALVAIIILPVGILLSFVPMLWLGISSNLMSLGGIAIAIGDMVDAAIVFVENAHKKLERAPPDADRTELLIEAAKEVGRPLFLSLLLITVAFFPVFTLEGQGGKLFLPLAFTKSVAIFFGALLTITLTPALMVFLIRGKLLHEKENPFSAFIIAIYRPFAWVALRNPLSTLLLAAAALFATVPLAMRLGSEFMPPLAEGDLLYMPTTLPGISIQEARHSLQIQDRILKTIPEVAHVFGKAGRAETPTDPAPLDMVETVIQLKPREQWRRVPYPRWYSDWAPPRLKALLGRVQPETRLITLDELSEEITTRMGQIPGWSNSISPPIKTRIDMLTTGVRTPVGIKVYGADLAQIGQVAEKLEGILKPIGGTRGVFAERLSGGFYIDVVPDRQAAARYGLNVGDVQAIVEATMGGVEATRTVEGRARYGVVVRYPQASRASPEEIRRILVPLPSGGMGGSRGNNEMQNRNDNEEPPAEMWAQAMPGMGGMGGGDNQGQRGGRPRSGDTAGNLGFVPPSGMSGWAPGGDASRPSMGSMGAAPTRSDGAPTAPTPTVGGARMVPLGAIAEVRLRTGPSMLKNENGFLVAYVFVDIDTTARDIGGYVDEAKAKVAAELGPTPGIRLEWTGQYELLTRMRERMALVLPLTAALVILLVYMQFGRWIPTFIVLLSVPFALCGAVWLMSALDYRLSVAVWVGMIALAGIAAETGIVMLVYLDEAYERYRHAGRIHGPDDVRAAVMEGAVMRVRPKLMTVGINIIGLMPILWSQGAGADVMGRIAAPMVGGLVTSVFLTLEVIPVVYMYWRIHELKRNKAEADNTISDLSVAE